MFLFFDAAADRFEVPPQWAKYITATPRGFRIVGDPTSGTKVYLYRNSAVVAVDNDLGSLLDRLAEKGIVPELSAFAISSLLHHGFVPVPQTEFEDTFFLSMGDSVDVDWSSGAPRVEFHYEYPWLMAKSRKDEIPSEEKLFGVLTEATERLVAEAGNSGFLMLSSGKDSVAVAMALAEAGLTHIPTVTYSSGPQDPEPPVAAEICKKLGLEHLAVEMPKTSAKVAETLTAFFKNTPSPGADLSQIPYVFATAAAAPTTGAVFDGGGNDSYMGYPVTGTWAAKMRLRVRGKMLIDRLQKVVSVDSPLGYVARSRPEASFPGRTIRHHETCLFMPAAVDTRPFWHAVGKETKDMTTIDLFGAVSERHIGPGASMKKHVLAANSIGLGASLPWGDQAVADYYFNLPEPDRFDVKTGVNKILVRKMLLKYLDYDASKVGKHYFGFDGAGFVKQHKDYVRSEIEACELWDRNNLEVVYKWLDRVDSKPLVYHAILTIFMVSGWHNHSRFAARTGLPVAKPSAHSG